MADETTVDYFDILVECAKKVMETMPEGKSPKMFWRMRIQGAWHELNSYSSSAFPDITTEAGRQWRNRLNQLLANLARECLMAAWWFGIQAEDGEDNPEVVAHQMAAITAASRIRL